MKKMCVRARVRYTTTTIRFSVFPRYKIGLVVCSLDCNLRVHKATVLILMWKDNSIGLGSLGMASGGDAKYFIGNMEVE